MEAAAGFTGLTPNGTYIRVIVRGVGASRPVFVRNSHANTGRLAPFRYKVNAIGLTPHFSATKKRPQNLTVGV